MLTFERTFSTKDCCKNPTAIKAKNVSHLSDQLLLTECCISDKVIKAFCINAIPLNSFKN